MRRGVLSVTDLAEIIRDHLRGYADEEEQSDAGRRTRAAEEFVILLRG